MAINFPTSQVQPAGQQPQAGTPSLGQASSIFPAGQYPGAAQYPSFGAPQVTLQNLGQSGAPAPPLYPGSQYTLADLPRLVSPYNAMQPYNNALSQPLAAEMPQFDPATTAAIQARLQALGGSDPTLNGQAQPHPASVSVRHMSAQEIAGTALHDLFQQEVVDPLKGYLHTWQTDPMAALGETALGLGVGAGIVAAQFVPGLDVAVDVGLLGAGAAMTLPGFISAWSDEARDPTDAHLVQALVSTGAAGLAIGTPIKTFKALTSARSLLSAGLRARQEVTTAQEAADLVLGSGQKARQALVSGAPVTRQIETLGSSADELEAQFRARGVDPGQGSAAALTTAQRGLEALQQRLRQATDAGDFEKAHDLRQQIGQHAQENLAPAQLRAAWDHLMLPSTPYTHVPLRPVDGVSAEVESKLGEAAGGIRGILRELGSGAGLGVHEALDMSPASAAEAHALELAAGSAHYSAAALLRLLGDLQKAAGVGEDRIEPILQALEEPEKWQALAPTEKAFAQRLRDVFDQASIDQLRHGLITHILQGRVPRYYVGVGAEGEAIGPVAETDSWLRNPSRNPHRYWAAAVADSGDVSFRSKTRAQLIADLEEQARRFGVTQGHRQTWRLNTQRLQAARRSLGQYRRHGNEEAANRLTIELYQELGPDALDLVGMEGGQLEQVMRAHPQTRELLQGSAVLRKFVVNHVLSLQEANYRTMVEARANLNLEKLQNAMGGDERYFGAQLKLPEFRTENELPDVLPETVFLGDRKGSPEAQAGRLGYYLIHRAIGNPGDFNYRPALYARDELAKDIKQAGLEAQSFGDMQRGVLGALYKITAGTKRVIMASPAWHALNVAGRAVGWLLSDPAHNMASLKLFKEIQQDPEAYHALVTEFGMAGGKHADHFEVTGHLARLAREEDGQARFPGALRQLGGPIADAYNDVVEGGFWRAVDQLQLAAYTQAKHVLRGRLGEAVPEAEVRRAAAGYANRIGGMVNPLYMNTAYRQLRNLVWFAPSYWSTFMHSLESMLPGAARMSAFLARRDGGRFVRFGAAPLRAIDYRTRRELVRMQRNWTTTYLMTTLVSADILNVIGSGHHVWENQPGHMMDIDVSNFVAPDQKGQPAYIPGMPFFRQGVDVANALGLGHDYGFAHQLSDPTWQQQDALHKAELAAGALMDGLRRVGAGKTSGVAQAGFGALTGETLQGRIGEGVQRKIDRPEALLSLVPAGSTIQRALSEYGNPQPNTTLGQQIQSVAGALLNQYTGVPSIYHMGSERAPIDDDKLTHYVQQRTSLHDELVAYSNGVFSGTVSPLEYTRHKQSVLDKLTQLNVDTWGDSSPSGALQKQRLALQQAYGLDQMGLPDDVWYARYDSFSAAWDQVLQAAAPDVRAQWWDTETAQWTDADYLEWEARQLRDALAGSIDGQNGQYIRAYQNQLYAVRPYLSTSEYNALADQDPYYSTYKTLLSSMGQTSPLGAFISAWSSPFSQTMVLPKGVSQDQAQQLADTTGQTVVRGEQAQALAQQAKAVARSPEVRQAGGQALASQPFQQEVQQDVTAAEGA